MTRAVQSLRSDVGATARSLYVIDVESGHTRRITRGAKDPWAPEWSPDGGSILFHLAITRDRRSPRKGPACSSAGTPPTTSSVSTCARARRRRSSEDRRGVASTRPGPRTGSCSYEASASRSTSCPTASTWRSSEPGSGTPSLVRIGTRVVARGLPGWADDRVRAERSRSRADLPVRPRDRSEAFPRGGAARVPGELGGRGHAARPGSRPRRLTGADVSLIPPARPSGLRSPGRGPS